jgi:hypothetical protein
VLNDKQVQQHSNHQSKEKRAMKRTMMFTAAVSLFLFCVVTAAGAQGYMDRSEDGKQVVAAAKFMQSQAQKLSSAKDIDRAWLTDNGHVMIKHGYDYMESGEMMFSGEGRSNMQEIGQQMLQTGQLLLKMGRQKGPLTQKEQDEIKKQIEYLNGKGKLMLDKGQMMM